MTSVVTVNRAREEPLGSDPSCPPAPRAPGMWLKIANGSLLRQSTALTPELGARHVSNFSRRLQVGRDLFLVKEKIKEARHYVQT